MANNALNRDFTGLTYNFGPLSPPALPRDNGLYSTGTDQLFIPGTRCITWDGKVFKYSRSGASCYTGRGNVFYNTISSSADGIDYSVLAETASVGDTKVVMTNGSTAVTENGFAGGQICMKPTETYTDGQLMMRTVIGNTAAAASGKCTIYLDGALETAMTTSNYAFVMPSPYTDIRYTNTSGGYSFGGVAATYVSAASKWFWLQTYGQCWIAPQADTMGQSSYLYYRSCYWRCDGTIDVSSRVNSYVTDQIAGFILDNNANGNGSTVIMLTVSI